MRSILMASITSVCVCAFSGPASAAQKVYLPGHGVSLPVVVKEVKAVYPAAALQAGIAGSVMLACVVRPDGTVGAVKVVKSLDPAHGFDRAAVRAMKQWRFKPGVRRGRPVAVRIDTEMTFTTR